MNLVPAAEADLEAVAALVNSAYRGSDGRKGWTDEADYIEGARTSAGALRADLSAQAGALLLIWRGEADGSLQGCVWLEPKPAGAWYLGLLSVRPEAQNRRLGREMLQAAEAYAAARGARRIRISVVNVRDTLIAWYLRRGYAPTGETLPFPYDDHRFGAPSHPGLAFVVLEKTLVPA